MSGWGSIYNNTRLMLSVHGRELARLQEAAASGLRVRRASDAPADAFRILGLRADGYAYETYSKNLAGVDDSLNMALSVMGQMSEGLTRVRELATQGLSGTYSPDNRVAVAGEIDAILQQTISLANTSHTGRYLFAGSSGSTRPFVARYVDGTIVGVDYAGSPQTLGVPVAPGVQYAGVLVGDDLFRNADRQTPEFLGSTGAAAGSGTASVRGDLWLTVGHEATTYGGASGIAPGDTAATGDTILGNGHSLVIDAPAGVLRLDDGPDVAFTGAETDLVLTNAAGDVVHVNVTGLGPAFQGTVAAQATGYLSLDEGASRVAIDFAQANLAVTDPATGRVLYVDCTGVARTGIEPVRVPGTYDVFGAIVTVRDILLNTRGLSEGRQTQLLTESIGALQEATTQLARAETSVGGQVGAMASLGTLLEDLQTFSADQAARLENADIVQVATELAQRQTLYEMTLAVSARLLRMSLLDYLE